MKIMNLGDLHFAEYKDFSTNVLVEWDATELKYRLAHNGKKVNSRLLDIANALIEAREYCVANDIKIAIVTGDVSHNRSAVPTTVQNVEYKVLESFKLCGIELIIIAGNHDQVSNEDFPENSLVPFQNIATIIDKPTTLLRYGASMLCIPFSPNKEIVLGAINSYKPLVSADLNIIVAHLGVSGGVTGKNSYVLTDQYDISELRYLDEDINFICLGHYHKPQIIPGTLGKVFYTGSPIQNNFGEEGEDHGFWLIDTKSKELTMHPLKAPKFITLTPENYKNYSKDNLEGNFTRVIGTTLELPVIIESVYSKKVEEIKDKMIRMETEKEYEAEHRSDISTAMSYMEIVSQYAKEHEINEEQLKIGLDILNSVAENKN